jgi:cytochrome oxidase Cu insertion factor (SCO1/SenC/PrrC family)
MSKKLLIAVAVVAGIAVLAVAGLAFIKSRPLPNPQIASFQGRPAPDFTLKDQNGQLFHLADHRGHPVVLYFYRGYW